MLRGGDEIGESVLLLQQLTGVVPLLPQVRTATDMGNCKNEATVQKAQAIRGESGGRTDPV